MAGSPIIANRGGATPAGGAPAPGAGRGAARPPRTRLASTVEHLALAALAFVPLLAVDRGVVTSDTKSYLYLDPARFLGQVSSMWLPTVALGTVTHQYIGYLFPMGPYYALAAAAHVPTWVAQRLWLGALLFAAGAGVLFLCSVLSAPLRGPGRMVAALAYMLSPYVLQYAARISVILLPWAGLPWLVALTALALRANARDGPAPAAGRTARWRHAALFALVLATVSGINASSVLYVAIAPCLWLLWSVAVEHEATWREAGATLAKMAGLSLLTCAWWIVGLVVEAGYGVDILRYTESVAATSSTSSPLEVLRGLGYWYFYGSGRLGRWAPAVLEYTSWTWLVAVSFAIPVLAFVAAAVTRWRHRAFFVALAVVGVVLSVGAFPYAHPSPLGTALKTFMNDTTAGLAMRSTDRATPLALLGLTFLLGAGADALWRRRARVGWAAGAAVCGLAVANNPAMFNGLAAVNRVLTQPARLPGPVVRSLRSLDRVHRATRVLGIPGDAFAAYTWGDTNDTPQPALLTRPFVTRQRQVMGSMATADMLRALDVPIQTSTGSLAALAPMARLLSAGNVLVEYDQKSAMYGSLPAVTLAQRLAATPRGLGAPRAYGRPGAGVATPEVDAEVLAGTPRAAKPPPIVTYAVAHPRPLVRAESDTGALVVAGDAAGLDTLAAQGLLDTRSAVYYAGSLDRRPGRLHALARHGATLVVTDTNRKQAYRWTGLSADAGQVQTAHGHATAAIPNDTPIDLFGPTPPGSRTIATYVGAADVTASSYGNPITFDPEDRPFSAIDGNPLTAWETGTFVSDVDGQWWQVDLGHRVTADHVTLVQPLSGTRRRHITRATLTFTGADPVTVRLGASSRDRGGQRVTFPQRSFRTLRVTIDATSSTRPRPVGLAEVEVPGQHVQEVLALPSDLLHALGARSRHDRLVVSMTRARSSPYTTARPDAEPTIARSFTLPSARTFSLSGTATLSTLLSGAQIDRLLGVPGATGAGVVATASSRLAGDLAGTAASAAGGGTAPWQSGFGAPDVVGSWLRYRLHAPVAFDHLTLRVLADRRHSVPRAVTLVVTTPATRSRETRRVALPTIERRSAPGSTVTVPLHFGAVEGSVVKIAFPKVHLRRARLPGGGATRYLPLGIASVGIPGVSAPAPPAMLPSTCRSNLLSVDGHPITVEVLGPTAAALGDGQVSIVPCGADATGIHLSAGRHVVTSALATAPAGLAPDCAATASCGGWNVDTLTFDSAPGGGPEPAAHRTPTVTPAGARDLAPPAPGHSARVGARETSATSWALHVHADGAPFELVLGESLNAGWRAVAHPGPGAAPGARAVTLGAPGLVDGFANGWHVSTADLAALGAGAAGARFSVTLTWTPQRFVWVGLAASVAGGAACVLLVLWSRRRRRNVRRTARARARSPAPRTRHHPDPGRVLGPDLGRDRRPPQPLAWWVPVLVALLAGAAAAAISQPAAGPGVAAAVWAGLAIHRLRGIGALVAATLVVAATASVVVAQVTHPAHNGGGWVAAYAGTSGVAMIALAFLGADALCEVARHLARTRRGP